MVMAGKHLSLVDSSDPSLRKTAAKVSDPKAVADLVSDMFATMKAEGGVGLAAPQVGRSVRVFVSAADGSLQAFINPVIKSSARKEIWWEEGCLSLPRLLGQVKRPQGVTVSAQDETGRRRTVKADDLLARVIQHEIDHLDGILFPDRMTDFASLRVISEAEWQERFTSNQSTVRQAEM
jgi:peptide deformylase